MKKDLIKRLVLELKNEGFDVEGFLLEDGVMGGNYGMIEFEFFDGLPNQESPYCSQQLKTIPCKKLADKFFGVNIGEYRKY